MEDASQSPGLAIEPGGADGAGAGGGASDELFFGRVEEDLAAASPVVELPAAVGFFFFTIARSGEDWRSGGGGAAVTVGRRRRKAKADVGEDWGFFRPLEILREGELRGHVSLMPVYQVDLFLIDGCGNQGNALVTMREGRKLLENRTRRRENGPSGSRLVGQNQDFVKTSSMTS